MEEEIRRAFNYKKFSYISSVVIFKSRSKIKVTIFEQLLRKFNETRWKIELTFRDIKHALGILHFHSKKDLFNLQEIFAHLIRYNLTSRIIRHFRLTKIQNAKYHYEINFKNAAQIVQDYCRRSITFNYGKILEQITHYVHPIRPNRLEEL